MVGSAGIIIDSSRYLLSNNFSSQLFSKSHAALLSPFCDKVTANRYSKSIAPGNSRNAFLHISSASDNAAGVLVYLLMKNIYAFILCIAKIGSLVFITSEKSVAASA
jgi:hypothetical protein